MAVLNTALCAAFLVHLFSFSNARVLGKMKNHGLKITFEFDNTPTEMAEGGEVMHQLLGSAARHIQKRDDLRPGQATTFNSCQSIRGVPANLRSSSEMKPNGLSSFYQKYTETYGIPVLSSNNVPDDALRRACYTLRFMLADRADIRQSFYSRSGRVAIMAQSEVTTSIPEHSNLDAYWNTRARGMGATWAAPVSSGAEENVLCYGSPADWYREDIFMHELAHGVDNLGATYVIANWQNRLKQAYDNAVERGLWANTYAESNPTEYFAEGIQSFFNVDDPQVEPGISNDINLQSELRTYDPDLYTLILEVFPCNNHYIDRCQKSRGAENSQQLNMNCAGGAAGTGTHTGGTGTSSGGGCSDSDGNCAYWANEGLCTGQYANYMRLNCKSSCNLCGGQAATSSGGGCTDSEANCGYWARIGRCSDEYAEYMRLSCKSSCNLCGSALIG